MTQYTGCLVPKKGQAEKLNLSTYCVLKNAPNKKSASIIIAGEFFQKFPDIAEHYFDVKIIEDKQGADRPALDEWSTDFLWNKETGEIELQATNKVDEPELTPAPDESKIVMKLPTNFRAAVLTLFGPVERITNSEYSLVIDLVNDEEPSREREMAEAISRTPRFLALLPERQIELLAAMREKVRDGAQWTDYKKFMDKWLDAPLEKRDVPAEVKPVAAPEYVSLTFEQKIAVAINAPAIELDEVTLEILSDATNQRKCEYPAFIRAHKALTYLQPTLEKFSDRLLGSAIRSVDFNEDKGIVACRRAVLDYLGVNGDATNEDETEPSAQNTAGVLDNENPESPKLEEDAAGTGEHAQKVTTGRSIFTLDELTAGPDVKPCGRPAISARETEIAIAINYLLAGHTDIMSKEEAEGVITYTGHLVSYVVPLLINDIESAELCLSPDFSDTEIHDVATTILDNWSDNDAIRQKQALDAIIEYRKPESGLVENTDSVNHELVKKGESVNQMTENVNQMTEIVNQYTAAPSLTYHQQLTISALQGLCANPACFGVLDALPSMAASLADGVMAIQGRENA